MPIWDTWMDRLQGEMEFYLTQVISGHGCFNAFLHKIGRLDSTRCAHYSADVDDVAHPLMECLDWTSYRTEMESVIGKCPISSEASIVRSMLSSANKWSAVTAIISRLMRAKKDAERAR